MPRLIKRQSKFRSLILKSSIEQLEPYLIQNTPKLRKKNKGAGWGIIETFNMFYNLELRLVGKSGAWKKGKIISKQKLCLKNKQTYIQVDIIMYTRLLC